MDESLRNNKILVNTISVQTHFRPSSVVNSFHSVEASALCRTPEPEKLLARMHSIHYIYQSMHCPVEN